jgi:O-antigen/teichoic acid export membrane protein
MMMEETLKQKTIRGLAWSMVEKFGYQLLQFIFLLVLARILNPEDFGLLAMVFVFILLSQVLIDGGLGSAIIQKKEATEQDYSTVFYFNLLTGIALYLILFFAAPVIAAFFKEVLLCRIIRILGLILIINAAIIVQVVKLRRKLDFKTQAGINLSAVLISGLLALLMAWKGMGVMSLVYFQLSMFGIKAVLYWSLGRWYPSSGFCRKSFKELWKFGSKLLAASILNQIFLEVYSLIIGRVFNARNLGFYDRARRFQTFVVQNINSTVDLVLFPALSRLQDDREKLSRAYRTIIELISFAIFPLMIMLFIIAKPLVVLLLTDKWLPAVLYLKLLCLAGLAYPLSSINLNILKVKGRTDLIFKLEIIKKTLIILIIFLTLRYGITGLIVGQIFHSLLAYMINSYYSGRYIDLNVARQFVISIPYLIVAALAGLLTGLLGEISGFSGLILLLLTTVVYSGFYLLFCRVLKLSAYSNALTELRNMINKK